MSLGLAHPADGLLAQGLRRGTVAAKGFGQGLAAAVGQGRLAGGRYGLGGLQNPCAFWR